MEKIRILDKNLRDNNDVVLKVGYCELQNFLRGLDPIYYNYNKNGWKYDVYKLDENVYICTGYAPVGNQQKSYEFYEAFDKKADSILCSYSIPYEKRQEKLKKLRNEFVKEVLK